MTNLSAEQQNVLDVSIAPFAEQHLEDLSLAIAEKLWEVDRLLNIQENFDDDLGPWEIPVEDEDAWPEANADICQLRVLALWSARTVVRAMIERGLLK